MAEVAAAGGNGVSAVAAQAASQAYSSRNVEYNGGFAKVKRQFQNCQMRFKQTLPFNKHGLFESFRDQL